MDPNLPTSKSQKQHDLMEQVVLGQSNRVPLETAQQFLQADRAANRWQNSQQPMLDRLRQAESQMPQPTPEQQPETRMY